MMLKEKPIIFRTDWGNGKETFERWEKKENGDVVCSTLSFVNNIFESCVTEITPYKEVPFVVINLPENWPWDKNKMESTDDE